MKMNTNAADFITFFTFFPFVLLYTSTQDLERNDGSPEKPYYMSQDLMRIVKKKNQSRPASPEIPLMER